jgi:hypothetical protein
MIKTYILRMTEQDHQELKMHCVTNKIAIQAFIQGLIKKELKKKEYNQDREQIIDKLYTYYYSEYVAKNQPHILEIEFTEWCNKELDRIYKEE